MIPVNSCTSGLSGTLPTQVELLTTDDSRQCQSDAWIVQEDVLTIEVESVGSYALMWTPTDDNTGAAGYTSTDGVLANGGTPEALALAVGFVFTEKIIDSMSDIVAMWICAERPDVVNIRLKHPEAAAAHRHNVVVNSSCGICGARDQVMAGLNNMSTLSDNLRINVSDFSAIRAAMTARQDIFARTGGTHAAVLFDQDLQMIASAEDIGRHNALDKVIGHHILNGGTFSGCGVFLSSRASYEMTAKAVRAGLELMATISAPTSLAVEVAKRHGLTLCGFVRGNKVTVYTHPQRIKASRAHQFY